MSMMVGSFDSASGSVGFHCCRRCQPSSMTLDEKKAIAIAPAK